MGFLKGLRCILRCQMHTGQGALEKAISSDDHCRSLVENLITAYSGGTDQCQDLGSLARALKNSVKLQGIFKDHVFTAFDKLECHLKHIAVLPLRSPTF